ncbi:MAG: aldose 1-epimerase, partial [Brevundimonas sp.]
MSPATAIRLQAGDWRATVAPEQGGAILSLDWRGQPVFRPTPEGATDMLETACFPLVPYANRIADARFGFEGRDVRLTALDRFAPHALHGDGWLNPWTVETISDDRVEMRLDWPGETTAEGLGWPWSWRALQT